MLFLNKMKVHVLIAFVSLFLFLTLGFQLDLENEVIRHFASLFLCNLICLMIFAYL